MLKFNATLGIIIEAPLLQSLFFIGIKDSVPFSIAVPHICIVRFSVLLDSIISKLAFPGNQLGCDLKHLVAALLERVPLDVEIIGDAPNEADSRINAVDAAR